MKNVIVKKNRNHELATKSMDLEKFNLNRLMELMHSIQSPALNRFLGNIFSDQAIMTAFMQLPASTQQHHNYVGGLMEHSIEAAEIAALQRYDNVEERDITVVAALLHDIGKTKSYTTNMKTTNLGKMVSHDQLTLEVCAAALRSLDRDWPDAANALRHIWTCSSPGSRYGFQPCTPLANIVRFADKFSADHYDHQKAYKGRQAIGFAWNETDRKYSWKATSEKIKNERRRICF